MDSPPPRPATTTAGPREDPAGRRDLVECLHLLAAGGNGQLSYHSTGGLVRLPITGPGHRTHWRPVRAQRIAFSPRHLTRDPRPPE